MSGSITALPRHFNPRAPRGARPVEIMDARVTTLISIHALREERDLLHPSKSLHKFPISIHALREERDRSSPPASNHQPNFNPRAPRGARPSH